MEITDLDGVGPARSDSLEEAGYDSIEVLADADPEELSEEADIPADRALDFIVQSQNALESEDDGDDSSDGAESDSEDDEDEDETMPVDLAEPDSETTDDDSADTEDVDEDEEYELVVNLKTDVHHDCYISALLNAYERRQGSHQPTLEAVETVLDDIRYNSGEVEHSLTSFELNTLHACVSRRQNDYKGLNMIDHMDAMTEVLEQINEVRERELP